MWGETITNPTITTPWANK